MRCPFCGHPDSRVLDTSTRDEGAVIRRRRECPACGERFTSYEKYQAAPLMVVKKDGRREEFDAQKILAGVITACEKRPVSLETMEQLVIEVERELRAHLEREVPAQRIGELVMERLRELDGVAYVRFASVYRQFRDIQRFKEELERLMEKP